MFNLQHFFTSILLRIPGIYIKFQVYFQTWDFQNEIQEFFQDFKVCRNPDRNSRPNWDSTSDQSKFLSEKFRKTDHIEVKLNSNMNNPGFGAGEV